MNRWRLRHVDQVYRHGQLMELLEIKSSAGNVLIHYGDGVHPIEFSSLEEGQAALWNLKINEGLGNSGGYFLEQIEST